MKTLTRFLISLLFLSIPEGATLAATRVAAQSDKPKVEVAAQVADGQMTMLIADEVRHRLIMLPYYGVFDWLECEIAKDPSAVLRGEVTRPTTKSDAEAVLRKIEGIPRIDNQIEVLPVSPSDDRIRIAVYRSVFKYEGPMFRYAIQSNIPIHIIVNNGRVTLKGIVDNAADRQLAYMAANGISGVFEVKNELTVANKG
jgi:hyperosmotically inducible periplasmic protein